MVKKPSSAPKDDVLPPLPSRDHFERAHFAVQAGMYLQQLAPGSANGRTESSTASSSAPTVGSTPPDRRCRRKPRSTETFPPYAALARGLGKIKPWAEHNQVKIDPSLKRAICTTCSSILVPGITSRVRIRPSKSHLNTIHTTCLQCNTVRVIPAAPSATPEPGVDGPARARRRAKRLRRVVFHEREATGVEEGGEGKNDRQEGDGSRAVGGEADPEKAATTVWVSEGHVLWRGREKVRGWGVPMPLVCVERPETKQQQPRQRGPKQPKPPKQPPS